METIDTDVVRILKDIGHSARLQDYLTVESFKAFEPLLQDGYSIDVFSVPIEGSALIVFVFTKKDVPHCAMATRLHKEQWVTVTGSHMRGLIVNVAKDVMEKRLRQNILGQWMAIMGIVILALAMVFPLLHYPGIYDDNYMLIMFMIAIVAVFGGCGAIPWLASRMFLERAWRHDPIARIIGHQLQALSTDK